MLIRVLFFGALREIIGRGEEYATMQDGGNVGGLFQMYSERFPRLVEHSGSLMFSRNREFVRRDEPLQEGDEIAFLPPVSGGTDDQVDSVKHHGACGLTRGAIDTRALVAELQTRADGAVIVFEGVVRDHSGSRRTLYLEYEGYEPMALAKMTEIAEEARTIFAIDRIGMVHRLGRMEIGEASVVIVVTSEHRGPAFEACRFAIDTLKRIVPIWKKEYFEDGAVWVEGEAANPASGAEARMGS